MTRVVVGVDGSAGSLSALRWAAGAAAALGAGLRAVAVAAEGVDADAVDSARSALDSAIAESGAAGAVVERDVVSGDPREVLLSEAARADVALTVVGSTGTGWFPSMHLGSVGHHLAQHAPGPVAVVPLGADEFRADATIVGIDGSPGSRAAAALSARLAASVHAVHAHQPAARAGAIVDEPDWRERSRRACEASVAPLVESARLADFEIVEGDPAKVLTDAAAASDAGLVILGSRGAGGFKGLRLGSVALRVLHHASRPTIVVPPADGERA
ncbi:MAG: universal stress protein [Acidimicrobiia bacterium]|nr:universal stress protein [Acidimicrobiia bacterium]